MIIYIRHAHDEHPSSKYSHKSDIPLNDKGKKMAFKISQKLIKKYGVPDLILLSPLYRTRQTATIFSHVINQLTGKNPQMYIDPRLSKYFTESQQKNPKVRKDTKKFPLPIHESKDDVMNRVIHHLNDICKSTDKNIWCITHAIILKYIAKHKCIDIPPHIEFLQTLVVNNDS